MIYHRVCNYINITGITSGTGTAYSSGAPEFTPGFRGVRVTQSLVLCLCFVVRCLFFFFCPLCCLSFFDLRILITSLWYLQTHLSTHDVFQEQSKIKWKSLGERYPKGPSKDSKLRGYDEGYSRNDVFIICVHKPVNLLMAYIWWYTWKDFHLLIRGYTGRIGQNSLRLINPTGTGKKCQMSEVTGFGIHKVLFNKECFRNTLGPCIFVECYRMLEKAGVGLHKFHCIHVSGRRVWRYQWGNQNTYIEEEQTTEWPKEKVQKNKQRSRKYTHKTTDRVTRTPLIPGVNPGAPEG